MGAPVWYLTPASDFAHRDPREQTGLECPGPAPHKGIPGSGLPPTLVAAGIWEVN